MNIVNADRQRYARLMPIHKKQAGAVQKLNIRNDAFVDAYIKNGGNATRAYLEVYCPTGSEITYETAGANAARLLKDARIRMKIDARIHELITPEWIEQEIQKDILQGDKQQRTAALNLLARVRSMVSEKRVNVVEQRKEFGEIVLDTYAETRVREQEKETPTA